MERADVIILGGGLVGLTLAIALDAHGLTAIVVDPADPAAQLEPGFDGRASAVASASWNMLEAIGLTASLEGRGCPITEIRVSDGLSRGGLEFRPDDQRPLGVMFENRLLRATLRQHAELAGGITLMTPARPARVERDADSARVTLDDDRELTAPLLVAAEGRRSPTREAATIKLARWRYRHAAIIGAVAHERPHGNIAYEIFYPAGPFAILPLRDSEDGRHRSALVWTVEEADAPGVLGLSDRGFVAEAERSMGGLLGRLEALSPRASYPLGFHHAATITAERLALVGDAAHGIHPIAGQGLNLGFRDVAALVQVLVEGARLGLEPGDAQLLSRYERWRALDTFSVALATDSLTRLFGLPGRLPRAARRFGLGAVQRIAPLKDRFMAEARGESGARPVLLEGMLA